jgi:hypothetical protein
MKLKEKKRTWNVCDAFVKASDVAQDSTCCSSCNRNVHYQWSTALENKIRLRKHQLKG